MNLPERNKEYEGEKIACHWMDCFAFDRKESNVPFEDCFLCSRNEDIKEPTGDWYESRTTS